MRTGHCRATVDHHIRFVFTVLLVFIALGRSAKAQNSTFQEWFSLPATYDVGTAELRPQLWTDLHVRRRSGSTLFIVRPAVGLRFNGTVTAHVGYAWISTFQDAAAPDSHEHRLFQQVILNFAQLPPLTFQARTRLEQRLSTLGSDVGLRVRQFVRAGWRIAGNAPYLLVLWDEIFVGLNDLDWGPRAGYDQNRLFFGPGVDVQGVGGRFELGYLWNNIRGRPDVNAHVLFVQLVVAL